MAAQSMFDKIWGRHVVVTEKGESLLYVDRALIIATSARGFTRAGVETA